MFDNVEYEVTEIAAPGSRRAGGGPADESEASKRQAQIKQAVAKLRNKDPESTLLLAFKPYGTEGRLKKPQGKKPNPWERTVGNGTATSSMIGIPATLSDICPIRHVQVLNDLDNDEEGLVVLGADSSLGTLFRSRNSHVHTYHVELASRIDDDSIQRLRDGIMMFGKVTRRAKVTLLTY